jgi:hypothetical protein
MMVRKPAVAGRFYPRDRQGCLDEIKKMFVPQDFPDVPDQPVGGIVPHAGWLFSGDTAFTVFRAIESRRRPSTFVLLGAAHRPMSGNALFSEGVWRSPLGEVPIDERLAGDILGRAGAADLLSADPRAHDAEHSLEVQLPLLQYLFPDVEIVPILVCGNGDPVALGRVVGESIRDRQADAVCIGSSDLTHYGPSYGFTPQGLGEAAVRWVRDENDRRMLHLMETLDAEKVVPEARNHMNACGAGAIAATLAAVRVLGATAGHVVRYTTSFDVLRDKLGRTDYQAAVGYPGVVF